MAGPPRSQPLTGPPGLLSCTLQRAGFSDLVPLFAAERLTRGWFGPSAGIVAAAVFAIWPNLVIFTTILSSELPFLALMMCGACLWDGRASGRFWWVAGIVWGAAMLLRPVIQFLPLGMAIGRLLRQGPGRMTAVLQAGLILVLMLVVVQPWAWRNAEVLQSSARVSTNFGVNLWMGNNPASDGGYMEPPLDTRELSEAQRDTTLRERAVAYMLGAPVETVLRSLRKLMQLHERETIGVGWNADGLRGAFGEKSLMPMKLLATGFWYLLLVAALGGVVMLGMRSGALSLMSHPAVIGWAYFSVLHALTVADDRYHMPGGVFLAMIGAGFADAVWRHFRTQKRSTVKD